MPPTIERHIAALEALVAEQPVESGQPGRQQNVNGDDGTGGCHGQASGQTEAEAASANQQGQPRPALRPQAGAQFQNGSNGYVPPQTPEHDNEILAACRYRRRNPPPPVVPVFRLNGSAIATRGNLVGVQAPAKAGKTAFLGAMIGSTIAPNGDFFGVTSCGNPQGHALIHFDYEQSPNDHYTCNTRAMIRAGLDATMDEPEWFRSYCLTGQTMATRLRTLLFEIEQANAVHGGVLAAIIDGAADLCSDPNDAKEAFRLIDQLHQIAIRYNTVIVCILHENPGSEIGKTRGHLGSQLERKAESNIRLVKDTNGVTTIFTEKSRHAHVSKEHGSRFQWSDEFQRHISVESAADRKASQKQADLAAEAVDVFQGAPEEGLTWKHVHDRISEVSGVRREGARRRFTAMQKAGVIRKAGENYVLSLG